MSVRCLLIAAAACIGMTAPAAAHLRLCNQTSYILYVATASATKTELDARGWTRIVPGDCVLPIREALTAPTYFTYAVTSLAHAGAQRFWGGNVPICARNTDFVLRSKLPIAKCPAGAFYRMPFALRARGTHDSLKVVFAEADIKALKEARRAGIDRLLEDLGYHVKVPGERARDQALEDFHRKARLPADSNEAELFAALETAGTKTVTPPGYTACNGSDRDLWVALGFDTARGKKTQGWWQVPRGGCSRLITTPLHVDHVYLRAQGNGKNGAPVVDGPVKLCVRIDAEFDLADSKKCNGNGLSQAGFAVTDMRGRSGYVANIGENGLVQPAKWQGKKK